MSTPAKKRKKQIQGQTSLSFEHGSVKLVQSDKASTSKAEEKPRTFQHSWKVDHHWLRYDKKTDEIFCTVCENANCKNVFTSGCRNFKSSALAEHIATRAHQSALTVPASQDNAKKSDEKQREEIKY